MAKKAGYTAVVSQQIREKLKMIQLLISQLLQMQDKLKQDLLQEQIEWLKYNQLLRIEDDLADEAIYEGKKAFYNIRLK